MRTARAPAKVNLTLHVTGRRDDGYHLLDSLVVFADVADVITAQKADGLSLTVTGPFAEGVPVDESNLILRAADLLARARGLTGGAALHLEKNLPHAAGIGSGSSDAAATLQLLAALWGVAPLAPDDPAVLGLGADVPVCLAGPAPQRMAGIGEQLSSAPPLPEAALVLARPPVAVPTGPVFQGLSSTQGGPMAPLEDIGTLGDLVGWLGVQRNDLQAPAIALAPVISDVIAALAAQKGAVFAAMSGSGATCYALFADLQAAEAAAREIGRANPGWWVAAADMLQSS